MQSAFVLVFAAFLSSTCLGQEARSMTLGLELGSTRGAAVSYDYEYMGICLRKNAGQVGRLGLNLEFHLGGGQSKENALMTKIHYESGLRIVGSIPLVSEWMKVRIGTGPFLIINSLNRQSSGFIFNNYLGFSFLPERYHWSFNLGFRHLSNAELRLPNGGINNFVLGIEYKI